MDVINFCRGFKLGDWKRKSTVGFSAKAPLGCLEDKVPGLGDKVRKKLKHFNIHETLFHGRPMLWFVLSSSFFLA